MAARLIPTAILARLRTQQTRLFTDSGTLTSRRVEPTEDGSWSVVDGPASTVSLNITPLALEARHLVSDRLQRAASHTIRVEWLDAPVAAGDRFDVGGVGYEVVGLADARTDALYVECFVVEVDA